MLASGARSQSKRAGSVFRPELSDSVPARYFAGLELCAFDVAVVIQTLSSCHQQAFEVPKRGVRIISAARALCGSLNLYQ